MLIKKFKEKKVLGAILALSLCGTLVLGIVVVYAQQKTEKAVANMPLEEVADNILPEDGDYTKLLYKDYVDEEVGKQVCKKYNLDFETISFTNMSDEILDYSSALGIAAKSGEQPLLIDAADDRIIEDSIEKESLEMQLNEGYAFGGADKVIKEYCAAINLNQENSKIKDLTADQLFEICGLCREASPHGDE